MRRLLLLFLAFFAAPALAQELSPEDLVKKVTADVLETVKTDKQLAAGDKQKALKLAEEKILPLIDFEEATRLAVGRAWREANPEQKKSLVSEFRSMLVRTYSNALEGYQGQTMKVLPRAPSPATPRRRCATSTSARAQSQYRSTTRCTRPARAGRSTTSRWKASAWSSPIAASSTPW
jgi:ABC-type transporter MlaC component